jgi:hypothetical protein
MKKILIISISFICLLAMAAPAQEYKKYTRIQTEESFLKISYRDRHAYMTFFTKDSAETISFVRSDARKTQSEILIHGKLIMNKNGFLVDTNFYSTDIIDRVEIEKNSTDEIRVNFQVKKDSTEALVKSRRQNRISIIDKIAIDASEFVRGSVVSFWSDVEIDGEINENVVALFGDIKIGDNAVVRGDIISIGGSVNISRKATVYGSFRMTDVRDRHRPNRWLRWYRKDRFFSPIVKLHYNRVDGLAPYLGIGFQDEDSLLPRTEVYGGYGFESERWRYHIGLEQTLYRRIPVILGGSLYRKLASNDDWIISEGENTAFAFLATEDYKDYFEAEGGYGFARVMPLRKLIFEIGILSEKYHWLDGHPQMWSLFGSSKRFRANFSSVDYSDRIIGMKEIENRDVTSLILETKLIEGEKEGLALNYSAWQAEARIEWSLEGGDKDFTQYRFRFERRQSFCRDNALLIRGVYGGSDGYLPLQRKFFIGGLGTLHGYEHKEYYGSEFWLGSLDYGFEFPKTDMTGWIFYNIGQITDIKGRLDSAEYKHSLGIGLSFGSDLRINIAKRLDRSGASPLFYIRMEHLFD